jgi:hypothetical protein
MNLKSSRGVQQHEVNAAADALIAQGVRPTIERVRAQMGRGSPQHGGTDAGYLVRRPGRAAGA